MGTPKKFKGSKGTRDADATNKLIEELVANLYREFREFELAIGAKSSDVRQPSDRREQQIQGSEHQEVQSAQETPQDIQAQDHLDGDSNTPRTT